MSLEVDLERAAEAIAAADALLIGAGAGMGVDSGLPDFRGPQGFWKAYPVFQGQQFSDISNPVWFQRDPELAWGFFGHRLHLYREATPHAGFAILRRWSEAKATPSFIFTSNVDGQFQKAGFAEEQMIECHGSIHYLQCSRNCTRDIWPTGDLQVAVDLKTIRATAPLPACPYCEGVARPNILMFGDWDWNPRRHDQQDFRYQRWNRMLESEQVVVLEFGAGKGVPTVRGECEHRGNRLIRVNIRDSDGPAGCISLPLPAREALERLDELIDQSG